MNQKLFFLLSILFLFSHTLRAEPSPLFTHYFTLGVEAMHSVYKEPDIYQSYINELDRQMGAVWMDSKKTLYGFNGSYRLTWKDTLFIQPEGRILWGKENYRVGRKQKINGKTNNIPVLLYEPRLIVGGKIPVINKLILSPYTGIGYRFKSDDSEESKYIDLRDDVRRKYTGNLGYYRKSNYVYIPFGTSAEYALNDIWSLSLKGEYDWIVKAWQYTRHPDLRRPLTNKQPNGYGLKGEVSVGYLYNKVKFSLSPYLNYWNIRNSERKDRAREPYNITWETGVKLGVTF